MKLLILQRLVSVLLILALSSDAYAYLDPGTGSLILQGLIAGAAVALVTIKTWWYWLLSLLGVKRGVSESDDNETESDDRIED